MNSTSTAAPAEARRHAPRYYVSYPYPTCLLQRVPEGAVGVTPSSAAPPAPANTAGLSQSSYARAVVVPHYAGLAGALREGPDYFFYQGEERPRHGVLVTLDALAALADAPEYGALVGLVAGSLGLDVRAIPYRGGGSDLPPAAPLPSTDNPADAWMEIHGYAFSGAAGVAGLYVYRLAGPPAPNKALHALLYDAGERKSKPGKGEPVRPEVLAYREERWGAQGAEDLPPIIVALPECPDFGADWAEAARFPRVFPVPMQALDPGRGDNLFFPRIYPAPATTEELPEFFPGPAMYSWRSAPWACEAMIFSGWRHFYVVRESHHSDPVERCPRDAYVLAQ